MENKVNKDPDELEIFDHTYSNKLYLLLLTGWYSKATASFITRKDKSKAKIKESVPKKIKKLKLPFEMKKISHGRPVPETAEHINIFLKKGWAEQEGVGKSRKRYLANLIPYFIYLEKRRNIKLEKVEKLLLEDKLLSILQGPSEFKPVTISYLEKYIPEAMASSRDFKPRTVIPLTKDFKHPIRILEKPEFPVTKKINEAITNEIKAFDFLDELVSLIIQYNLDISLVDQFVSKRDDKSKFNHILKLSALFLDEFLLQFILISFKEKMIYLNSSLGLNKNINSDINIFISEIEEHFNEIKIKLEEKAKSPKSKKVIRKDNLFIIDD